MKAASGVEDSVRELLSARAPLARSFAELPAELPENLLLGPGGLGLDSIALVELLLDCEYRFGLAGSAELLAGPPLTVDLLVAHIRAAVAR
jgi:acyl carrier protein